MIVDLHRVTIGLCSASLFTAALAAGREEGMYVFSVRIEAVQLGRD